MEAPHEKDLDSEFAAIDRRGASARRTTTLVALVPLVVVAVLLGFLGRTASGLKTEVDTLASKKSALEAERNDAEKRTNTLREEERKLRSTVDELQKLAEKRLAYIQNETETAPLGVSDAITAQIKPHARCVDTGLGFAKFTLWLEVVDPSVKIERVDYFFDSKIYTKLSFLESRNGPRWEVTTPSAIGSCQSNVRVQVVEAGKQSHEIAFNWCKAARWNFENAENHCPKP